MTALLTMKPDMPHNTVTERGYEISAFDRHPAALHLLPLLFRRVRGVQFAEPLKYVWKRQRRRFLCYRFFVRLLWALTLLLPVVGVLAFCHGYGTIVGFCPLLTFWSLILAWMLGMDNYAPLRCLAVRSGLFLYEAQDRRRFVAWNAIQNIRTKTSERYGIIFLTTDAGHKTITAESLKMLPFVNQVLELLPPDMEREPLVSFQRQLRHQLLYASLFVTRELLYLLSTIILVPICVAPAFRISAETIGFGNWLALIGGIILFFLLLVYTLKWGMQSWHSRQIDLMLDELASKDFEAKLAETLAKDKSARHDFGEPPRTVSPKVRRIARFSGEAGGFFMAIPFLLALVFWIVVGVHFGMSHLSIRYHYLPFRWVAAGEGNVVAISAKEIKSDDSVRYVDEITFETTLPDGRVVRATNPETLRQGELQIGQAIPLLQYPGEQNCFRIGGATFRREMGSSIAGVFMGGAALFAVLALFYWLATQEAKQFIRLMESAEVQRFRIRNRFPKKSAQLEPMGDWPGPLEIKGKSYGAVGQAVTVFLDKENPQNSFVAESFGAKVQFDPQTGMLDCDSDKRYRIGVGSFCLLGLAIVLWLVRILLAI